MLAMTIPLAARTFGTKNGKQTPTPFRGRTTIESTLGRKAGRVFLFHTESKEISLEFLDALAPRRDCSRGVVFRD